MEPSRYHQLLADIDRQATTLQERFPAEITCHVGCTGCCRQHLSVFAVEAENLRRQIRSLDPQQQARLQAQALATLEREAQLADQPQPEIHEFPPDPNTAVPCPALFDQVCSVYEARPVICRTHGFPLLYADEESEEALLDVCPLNFSESGESLEYLGENEVFHMHGINERLVRINLEHVKNTIGSTRESFRRQSIAEIILTALQNAD